MIKRILFVLSMFISQDTLANIDILFNEALTDLKKYHSINHQIVLSKNEIWDGLAYSSFLYEKQKCIVFFENLEKESFIVLNPPIQNTLIKKHIIYHELMHCIFASQDISFFFNENSFTHKFYGDLLMLESLYEGNNILNNKMLFDEISADVYATAYLIRQNIDQKSLEVILRWRQYSQSGHHNTYAALQELTKYDIKKLDINSLHQFLNYVIVKNFFDIVKKESPNKLTSIYYRDLLLQIYNDYNIVDKKIKNKQILTEFEKIFIGNLKAKIFTNANKDKYLFWDVLSFALYEKDFVNFITIILDKRYKVNYQQFLQSKK